MRILFTGASSFTGYWFVKELALAGHEIVMTFRCQGADYDGIRRSRVESLRDIGHAVYSCSFGDERFLELIGQETSWDMLCHHAAEVTDYKSQRFDVAHALHNNTRNLPQVLEALAARGCRKVLLTGSVFEGGEGAGSEGLPAFSPYGVSKEVTARVFVHYTQARQMRLGKLVIPNPFGPYEEPRFTAYLIHSWYKGKKATVNTPDYVRDNIHVSLLAKAYADFAGSMPATPGFHKSNPSGYLESQGSFASRFARNMRARLDLPCELELKRQIKFTEPRIRINTDQLDGERLGWDETAAWNDLAAYYKRILETPAQESASMIGPV